MTFLRAAVLREGLVGDIVAIAMFSRKWKTDFANGALLTWIGCLQSPLSGLVPDLTVHTSVRLASLSRKAPHNFAMVQSPSTDGYGTHMSSSRALNQTVIPDMELQDSIRLIRQ